MNYRYFGDPYDLVKQSLLGWLRDFGRWDVHPMFTDDDPADYRDDYCRLLGVDLGGLVFRESINGVNRQDWLAAAENCTHHIFIDPDTGALEEGRGRKPPNEYLRLHELVAIANARPRRLTLVYDQALGRGYGQIGGALLRKLNVLQGAGIHGVAYHSRPSFLLVSTDQGIIRRAADRIQADSRLPGHRFVWLD